ncbi:MAG: terminase [Muribaculum sp.]|nr:terminase [Muribaculum sp.]
MNAYDIIEENDTRLRLINSEFDPISGKGSPGRRVRVDVKDAPGGALYLPEAMMDTDEVKLLVRGGSYLKASANYPNPGEYRTALDRQRIRYDFPYWAATYAYIKRKGGGPDSPFVLNRPQRKLVECFEAERSMGRPIRLVLLKARQWGGSTCTQLYMAWLQMVVCEGLNSLIIAHQGAGTDEIKDMFDRMIEHYPLQLLYPPDTVPRGNEKKMVGVGRSGCSFRVPQRNCKVKIGTAERPDSCRGGDYNLVHLSEVGIWKATMGKKPEDTVRAACSGVLNLPDTMIVMESTANGVGNYFHREYLDAKKGVSQFHAFFISWFDIDQYTIPFATEGEKINFAEKLLSTRKSAVETGRTRSGQYMWNLWEKGATLEALHWFETERAKYADNASMASEYPSDDIEAFAHSGHMVFASEAVERLRPGCRDPEAIGELSAEDYKGFPDLSDIRFMADTTGCLKIWSFPLKDIPAGAAGVSNRYLTVVDIGGRSDKSDWTVITVFDRLPDDEGKTPTVAAQWRGHTDIDLVAVKAAVIAAYYDYSLLVIESNTMETRAERISDTDSSPYPFVLLSENYPNLYARRAAPDKVESGHAVRYGFHTNVSTKPMVISTLIKAVREGEYVERDAEALKELRQYERLPNGSFAAVAGCHDDILMTRAIGLHISYHEMDEVRILPLQHRKPARTSYINNEANFM